MNIELIRTQCGAVCTIGDLYINGAHQCYTLEDVVRPDGEKVFGETAIPAGRYQVVVSFSNRFQRELPLLRDVPNFEGIRIHPGNTAADTHGCVLVGMEKHGDTITHSRVAFEAVFAEIRDAIGRGEAVWIDVKDALS